MTLARNADWLNRAVLSVNEKLDAIQAEMGNKWSDIKNHPQVLSYFIILTRRAITIILTLILIVVVIIVSTRPKSLQTSNA
jgi:hypothetical protein